MPSAMTASRSIPMNEGIGGMPNELMMGLMMAGGGLVLLLILAVLVFSLAALVKYLRGPQ